jgi:hypothetical protein
MVHYHLCTTGLFGVIGLTKIDLIDSKLASDVSSMYSSSDINRMVDMVKEKTGFDISRIRPMKFYHNEIERSPGVECLTMETLAEVVQQVHIDDVTPL